LLEQAGSCLSPELGVSARVFETGNVGERDLGGVLEDVLGRPITD
jgi:hypothetical protein